MVQSATAVGPTVPGHVRCVCDQGLNSRELWEQIVALDWRIPTYGTADVELSD